MNFVKKLYFRQIAIVVAFAMLILGAIPVKSMAYVTGMEPAMQHATAASRAESMARVQRVLESKLVSERLQSVGLSAPEVESRIQKLSDTELHRFASQLDALYPGGDGFSVIIAILVIVILVMIILKLADRKIVIK